MNKILLAAFVSACAFAPSFGTLAADAAAAPAAAPAKAVTPQQQKMKDCNADATSKSLKGADRKAFMKTCLSNTTPASSAPAVPVDASNARKTQQQKMKDCNAEAKTKALKGDDRKTFMSTCLSG